MLTKLSEAQCRTAMKGKEFGSDILGESPAVAIVLTQSWCPQWVWMKTWLFSAAKDAGYSVFWLEYDREPFFEDFMEFKESVFRNHEVPYIRYYRNGVLVRESNFIDKSAFLRILG